MTTDYRPVACDGHSSLELLAMRRTRAKVTAVDELGHPLTLGGTVVDVVTRDQAEYLVLEKTGGERVSLRLDRLRTIRGEDGVAVWRQ